LAKSPRFFCENCGAEVDRNTKNCPRCGRYFASVRCPSCGFTAAEEFFVDGCPVCGYSSPSPGTGENSARRRDSWTKKPPRIAAGALPFWVYLITLFFLFCVFALLFVFMKD
jgi:predicted RNA-binding Zn-ribbon protein involved in translation (DUF1610 family)